jgi:glycosyltransferase involved in cell wall biosynthesis
MKIFVAIPVYDGKLPVQTVKCLCEETTVANGVGDELRVNFLPSCSVPAQGRNQLVQMFLESDCDRLFFLDADLTFLPGSIIKLAHMPVDFVGGCYRYKSRDECYPINWLPKSELYANELGLLEVAMLPTGFLSLSRNVFESFRKHYPGREYEHWGSKAYAYFQMYFKDGALYSDDAGFCKEWAESGGKIYLDPELTLVHWDFNPTAHPGHIGNWLKTKNGITQSEGKL